MADNAQLHVGLERLIAPRVRVGVQVTAAGAFLLILFLPRYGLLANALPTRLDWILSAVAALIVACGIVMVIVLPAYYRRLSAIMKQSSPADMRVTLRFEPAPNGQVSVYAELRPFDAEATEPVQMVVPVMKPIDIPPHTPARVYGVAQNGPVVIDTIDGILWPEPDERQKRLEDAFRVR